MFFPYNLLSLHIYTTSDYKGFLVIVKKNRVQTSEAFLCDSLSWTLPLVFAWNHFWLPSLALCPCLCSTIFTRKMCARFSLWTETITVASRPHPGVVFLDVLCWLTLSSYYKASLPSICNKTWSLVKSDARLRTVKEQNRKSDAICSDRTAAPGSCNLRVGREKSGSHREGSRLSGTISSFER